MLQLATSCTLQVFVGMNRESQREAYTVIEVAEKLGIGKNPAYEAVRRGEIPSIRLGGRVIIPKARFHRWLNGVERP